MGVVAPSVDGLDQVEHHFRSLAWAGVRARGSLALLSGGTGAKMSSVDLLIIWRSFCKLIGINSLGYQRSPIQKTPVWLRWGRFGKSRKASDLRRKGYAK
jgi:hypothetical protein